MRICTRTEEVESARLNIDCLNTWFLSQSNGARNSSFRLVANRVTKTNFRIGSLTADKLTLVAREERRRG